jgi:hypothetical protein
MAGRSTGAASTSNALPAATGWCRCRTPTSRRQGDASPCRACRLNRNVADPSDHEHALLLGRIEVAKRRLVSQLIGLGLPGAVQGRRSGAWPGVRPARPHARWPARDDGPCQRTDHPEHRGSRPPDPRTRAQGDERTVSHAARALSGTRWGHYYWDLLVRDTGWIEPFRSLFGDERQDYGEALRRNYTEGPAAGLALPASSAPTPARIRGRTGRKPGRTTST